ncbi:MAG: response regulator [Elusimicrobia bacterium]|nr:response regulator [Elusimicrobiota bacterium]
MPNKKILIIEDDRNVNEVIKENLRAEGYLTVSAYDGAQATQYANSEKPDLITLDINMPAGKGDVIYERLKKLETTRNIPVIIITAQSPENMEKIIVDKNIRKEDIFYKPIRFEKLLEKINMYLGGREGAS